MKAYWVSLYTEISDQDNLKKYGENAIPVIKKFGGTPVVRGGKLKYYSCLLYTSPSPRDQ